MKSSLFIVFSLLAWSSPLPAHEVRDCDLAMFCFEVVRSFDKAVVFAVDRIGDKNLLSVTVYSEKGGYDWGKVKTRSVQDLTDDQVAKLDILLTTALDLPDYADAGLDGSMWYLTVPRPGYFLRVGFWTPSYKPEERHLEGFYALGTYLWTISGVVDQGVGDLY